MGTRAPKKRQRKAELLTVGEMVPTSQRYSLLAWFELYMKVIIGAIWGGGALLLISVLRQRLIERKSDKYEDVEI